MYTGNSINPSVNNHNIGKNSQFQNRPGGFAIIQLRHPDPIKVIAPEQSLQSLYVQQPHINHYHGNGQTQHSDIARIIKVLEPRLAQESVPQAVSQETADKPTQNLRGKMQSLTDSIDDTTALAVTAGLGGLVTGMLLHSKLGAKNAIPNKVPSKSEITDSVIKMMPELIKAVATGTTMVATAVGLSSWLNQETPERLRARLEATKGN
jgi:predicted PurR-regulated permease PerM